MTTQDLRPGFVYTTAQAAAILGKSRCQVVRLCDAGDLWTWRRDSQGEHRRIAMDIDATERLLGHSTEKSRKARAAAGA